MSLRMLLSMMSMAEQVQYEVGVSNLTESDKKLLIAMWSVGRDKPNGFQFGYEDYTDLVSGPVSRSQFFKSIKKITAMGMVNKIGSERSYQYKFVESESEQT